MRTKLILIICFLPALVGAEPAFETLYEKSGGQKTPGHEETFTWFEQLAESSEILQFETFGQSAQGRELPLVVANGQGKFTAAQHQGRQDEVVLLVEACIHAGESCGKDAGMLLLRELATNPKAAEQLLDKVTVLFIPIFNVDGHERFGPYNRINQNGPQEMGWRVTANNQNLNRDFLKADTIEMRAWLKLYQQWLPDFFIDVHSTDGADYQYPLTYGLEVHGNMDPGLSKWTRAYEQTMNDAMLEAGFPMAPYISFKEWHDPRSGLSTWVAGPRFSQGYTAIQNRPGLLIETHMLKDYPTRVESAHQLILETLVYLNDQAESLRAEVLAADERTASAEFRQEPLALSFKLTENSRPFEFLGVSYDMVTSEITGGDWFRFSDQKETMYIEMFDELEPDVEVQLPEAYVIPAQWDNIIDRLEWHGVAFRRLAEPVELEIDTWRFNNPKWRQQPYEGHHPVSFEQEPLKEKKTFPAGSVVVDMNQRTARVAAHLLAPEGPDSMLRWGYLDAIFERVEYVESYVIENMIREMVAEDPGLLTELKQKKDEDPEFAANPWAIRYWFYAQTPYYDQRVGIYPVGMLNDREVLRLLPLAD